MNPEEIRARYEPRILAILDEIADNCGARGLAPGKPFELSDGDYSWWLTIYQEEGREDDKDADVVFTILTSEENDGEEGGVAFGIGLSRRGGEILGDMTPYNYTYELWVDRDNAEAVEERFQLFEADVAGNAERISDLILGEGTEP